MTTDHTTISIISQIYRLGQCSDKKPSCLYPRRTSSAWGSGLKLFFKCRSASCKGDTSSPHRQWAFFRKHIGRHSRFQAKPTKCCTKPCLPKMRPGRLFKRLRNLASLFICITEFISHFTGALPKKAHTGTEVGDMDHNTLPIWWINSS